MDDERVRQALRAGPEEDDYVPTGRWLRTAEERLGESAPGTGAFSSPVLAFLSIAAAAAVFVVLAVVGPRLLEIRDTGAGGLTARVEQRGALRVAIDGGPPQVFMPTGGYEGFDTDVARNVADRLGVRLDLVLVPQSQILSADSEGRWDVALSSIPASARFGAHAHLTDPYAVIHGAIAVASDSRIETPGALAGAAVCAAEGSVGHEWAAGALEASGRQDVVEPPAFETVLTRATVDECAAEVRSGSARAVVVDRRSDLVGRPDLRLLDTSPFNVPILAVVDDRTDGYATLVARLNGILSALVADGTIRDISERRLAGEDASPPR